MSDIQTQANNQLCEENAKILIYKSRDFCKMLYAKISVKDLLDYGVDGVVKKTNKKKCRKTKTKTKLVGFYIHPNDSNLSIPNNSLNFRPVWVKESMVNYTEFVGPPIQINHIAESDGNIGNPNPCNAHIIANLTSTPTFNHDHLQFSNLTHPNYDRAFISRYELFCLVQHSKYIGIVGARVSTGNIVPLDISGGNHMIHDCNKNYFTYRFIGFNSFRCRHLAQDQIALLRSNYDKNSDTFIQSIPAETWATPCPPRWI